MTNLMDFLDSNPDFFDENADYIACKYSVGNSECGKDCSNAEFERDEHGLRFIHYSVKTDNFTHGSVLLDTTSFNYIVDAKRTELSNKEVTFYEIPIEESYSQELSSISITKIS